MKAKKKARIKSIKFIMPPQSLGITKKEINRLFEEGDIHLTISRQPLVIYLKAPNYKRQKI